MAIPWREWSPHAFAQAEAEKKPILLSLVTAWSDECTAMDRTTYADPDVASAIDRQFVPVRVDADRQPDVNERYNLGGWPTTAFLTSSGAILSGGTYLSATQMVGMLRQVADAYPQVRDDVRVRLPASAEATAGLAKARGDRASAGGQPDRDPPSTSIDYFRSLLIDRFDPVHGGFGMSPKLPHPYALLFALSLSDDLDLSHIVSFTLERLSALWDPVDGGFHRYADAADWGHPGTEKTLEDNAALLHVYVEAAVRGRSESRDRAAGIVQWARGKMADQVNGGFYNAQSSRGVDASMYVDRNAMMVGAFIRAAALFDDIWLRDFALKSLETIIVPTYTPGDGVGHAGPLGKPGGGGPSGATLPIRGLLTDQIHVASALIWAHAATGRLPYSMLAAELMQFAIRRMWNDQTGTFRDRASAEDPVMPFDLNCHTACVLGRLAVLTGDNQYLDRARRILDSLAADYRQQDLFGALYALAVREVIDGQPPAGLELAKVDWQLG